MNDTPRFNVNALVKSGQPIQLKHTKTGLIVQASAHVEGRQGVVIVSIPGVPQANWKVPILAKSMNTSKIPEMANSAPVWFALDSSGRQARRYVYFVPQTGQCGVLDDLPLVHGTKRWRKRRARAWKVMKLRVRIDQFKHYTVATARLEKKLRAVAAAGISPSKTVKK